jgi:hypothetical protein
VYNLVIGWVFVFDSLHVKEGPTRLKQAVYYTLMAAELTALLALWYMQAKDLVRRHSIVSVRPVQH